MRAAHVDLHVHTRFSDGRLTPEEVLAEAGAAGLAAVAITDHDVLTGVEEAREAAPADLEVVPGIEMTAAWEGGRAIHILGYFVDPTNAPMRAALARGRALMAEHVERVLAELRAVGEGLEAQDLDAYRHRYAGGAALVLAMVQRGVLRRAPRGTAFRLLRMAAHEPRAVTVAEAVALIHGAGGVASLAHPAKLRRGQPLLSAGDLAPLASAGLDALEAWQWIPDGWGSDHYRAVAAELGLLVSGGSDDHGRRAVNGRTRLGAQAVPLEVLEALRERSRRYRRLRAP